MEEMLGSVLPIEAFGGRLSDAEKDRIARELGEAIERRRIERYGEFDASKNYQGLEAPVVSLAEGVPAEAAEAFAGLLARHPIVPKRTAAFPTLAAPNFRIRKWYHTVTAYRADDAGTARLVVRSTPDVSERSSVHFLRLARVEEVWYERAGKGWELDHVTDVTEAAMRYSSD